jgi:4-alpha-glucanotransferase
MNERASGILLHITSLPSKYGIGDLGPGAYGFVDFLVRGRQRYWQVLPLNQIILDGGYSPYNCLSVFGGNTLLISPELLYREGLLTRKDFQGVPVFPESRVNYKDAIRYKRKLLDIAFERFRRRSTKAGYERFCSKNNFWLKDYALFAVLCEHFGGWLWGDWPSEIAERNKAALETVEVQLQDAILKEKFLQYLFFKQWFSLRDYCRQKGVGIIGDIGFYVAYESADVWSHPEIFKLTWAGKPKYVGGVPPDYFSKKGQMWGNPVYDWRALGNSGYEWWIKRVRHNLNLFDVSD